MEIKKIKQTEEKINIYKAQVCCKNTLKRLLTQRADVNIFSVQLLNYVGTIVNQL